MFLNYASSGAGSGAHLFTELFRSLVGIEMSSVHYKGAAPATIDVLAGQVPVLFENILTNKSLQTPDMRERLRLLGATPGSGTPGSSSRRCFAMKSRSGQKWLSPPACASIKPDRKGYRLRDTPAVLWQPRPAYFEAR